jgi:putative transposase
MELRKGFVAEAMEGAESIAELCRKYEISRVTGYKWLQRFEEEGEAGLEEQSRAPQHCPQAIPEQRAQRILELRREHPRWGPRKLLAYLEARGGHWPAASSIGALLKREGLSHARLKRARTPPYGQPLAHAEAPNRVWCADFKGWFQCGDGTRCDPLTITDAYSRYILRARIVPKTDGPHVQSVFEAVFRQYGLPDAIRSDNGPPFASKAPGGLSRLAMWWLHLGIQHERIEPGCPQQNGRHERMHLTLKQEVASPPCANLRLQQQALERFEWSFNHERPHQALQNRTPAELYTASARPYPNRLPELKYPDDVDHYRSITSRGAIKWKGNRTFLSEVLIGQTVGLREIDEEIFEVYYGPILLGCFDGHASHFAIAKPAVPKKAIRK